MPIKEVWDYYRHALELGMPSEEKLFEPPAPAFLKALSMLPVPEPVTALRRPALDVGFGNGQYAMALAALGYEVDCVDVVVADRVRKALSASGLASRLRLHEVAIESFPIDRAYSVVVAKDVLHFCAQEWLSNWLNRLSEAAPAESLHYLSVFTSIERLDSKGRAIRLEGEAHFSRESFSSMVHGVYSKGWDVELKWSEHHQHSLSTGSQYFSAWRCSVVAMKGRTV